jgi:hypothetical protein
MFRSVKLPKPLSIIDIAPIVLYCLGLGIPENMDGTIPEEIITSDYLQNHPVLKTPDQETVHKSDSLTEKETRDLMDRLKGLGYL